MEKYLIDTISMKSRHDQIFCVNDYGVEGELKLNNWYEIICEDSNVYTLKNEWGEIETYSKNRFKKQKPNKPL
jgi:hypothetical protein